MRSTSGKSPSSRTRWLRNGSLVLLLLGVLCAWLLLRRDGASEHAADGAQARTGSTARSLALGIEPQQVPAAFAGTVRGSDGRPIADAEVCAACASCDSTEMPASACTRSAPSGAYALAASTTRQVVITAAKEGYEVGYARDGLPITVRSEAQSSLDIVLTAGGAQLSGTVVDAFGGPVARARVTVEHIDRSLRWVRESKSDDEGRFVLHTGRGYQTVRAEIKGYAPRSKLVVAPAQDVVIQMTPESVVHGRVVDGASGEPIEGVAVSARPDGFRPRSPSAPSDHDGTFTLSGLEPGRYRLSAASTSWRSSRELWIDVHLADVMKDVVVEVAAAVELIGRVQQREKGALVPCARGMVTLDPLLSAAPAWGPSEHAAGEGIAAQIGVDGQVRFAGLAVGRYTVGVRCAERVLAEGPRQLEVVPGAEPVTWTVEPGLALTVNVVDALLRPVPNADVYLVGEREDQPPGVRSTMPVTADAHGRAVVRDLVPGKYYALFPSNAERSETPTVQLKHGSPPAELTLRLAGSGSIDVVARDDEGNAVSGLQVSALLEAPTTGAAAGATSAPPPSFAMGASVRASESGDGLYHLGPLQPGSYEIRVEDGVNPSRPEGAPRRVQVRPGDTQRVQVAISRSGVVRGTVVNERGEPEDNAWVTATPEGEEPTPIARATFSLDPPDRALTNAEGEFELSGLRRGARYTLRIKQPFDNSGVLHGVSEGQIVRFVLPASATVAGVLVDPRGAPIPFAPVSAQHPETRIARNTVSGPDGSFSLERIPAGRVQLRGGDPVHGFGQLELDLSPGQRISGQALSLAAAPTQAPPGVTHGASPAAPAATGAPSHPPAAPGG
jgi:hypothetical protein